MQAPKAPQTRTAQPAAQPAAQSVGKNISATVEGDELVLRVKIKERHGESASGKTIIVASSGGNVQIEGTGGVVVGFNAYVKNPNYKK